MFNIKKFLCVVALVSGVVGQNPEFITGFDLFPSSSVGLLATSLVGVGQPITTAPFRNIKYSSDFRVLRLNSGLIRVISAPSAPNVLISAKVRFDFPAGRFTKSDVESFDMRLISFACVENLLGILTPTPCTVLFTGTTTSQLDIPLTEVVSHDGRNSFVEANLNFGNLRGVSFTVNRAGNGITPPGEVSLLLDNFIYTPNTRREAASKRSTG